MHDTAWPLALLLALVVPGAAPATECAGVELPDVVAESEPPLRLNGSGLVDGFARADFARAVLGNWLGAHAVDAGLETGLLGGPYG